MKYTGSFNPLQFQMMQVSVVTVVWLLSCLPVRGIDLRSREGKMWQGREKQLELDRVSENERDREQRLSDPSAELLTSLRQTALVS